jgi:hypothetical protein
MLRPGRVKRRLANYIEREGIGGNDSMVECLEGFATEQFARDAQWQGLKPIFFGFGYGTTSVMPDHTTKPSSYPDSQLILGWKIMYVRAQALDSYPGRYRGFEIRGARPKKMVLFFVSGHDCGRLFLWGAVLQLGH